jgi:hypothetical protein
MLRLHIALRGGGAWLMLGFLHACPSQSWEGDDFYKIIKEARQPPPYEWTRFVKVDGQPEPVPAEWVSTPEGQFAHSLKIPDPVPVDSGYRPGMKPVDYFLHLCRTEAKVMKYQDVRNLKGFMGLRPPEWARDYDLMDRKKLEAPSLAAMFQLLENAVRVRGAAYIYESPGIYEFYEEPASIQGDAEVRRKGGYLQASGANRRKAELREVTWSKNPKSRYALTWRGVKRPMDRESGIAGIEVIALDRTTTAIVGVYRDYALTGRTPQTPQGAWWLNAALCPRTPPADSSYYLERHKSFVYSVLRPERVPEAYAP